MALKRSARRAKHPPAPKPGHRPGYGAVVVGCLPPLAFFLAMTLSPPAVQLSRVAVACAVAGAFTLFALACLWLYTLYDRVADIQWHYEDYRESYYRMTWERNAIYREMHHWKAEALARGAGRRAIPNRLAVAREEKRRRARARAASQRQLEAVAS